MTDTHNTEGGFDPEERRQQIIAQLEALSPEKARKQLGILPYYHAIENAVTKPNQGTFVTRYFRTKWRPALGNEAAEIVLAVRFLADRETGETYAGYEAIADIAGLSVRCVERWLSHQATKNRSTKWLDQWRLLHTYFILGKKKRYNPVQFGNRVELRRTTNKIRIAMDDPVHPDDRGQLFILAAERMLEEEQKSEQTEKNARNRPVDGYGSAPYAVTVEKSPRNRPVDGYIAPTSGRGVSSSYRMNVINVGHKSTRTGSRMGRLAHDPRVVALDPQDRVRRERMADLAGEALKKLQRDYSAAPHRNAAFHRRVAFLMDPTLVQEALAATQDAVQRERSGELKFHKDADAYFGATVIAIAEREGIDLGLGQRGVAGQIEALARPEKGRAPALPAATGAQGEIETSTPEKRARVYADNLFPWKYAEEHGGRKPSEAEKQAAYEQRLDELTRGGRPTI